MNSALRKVSCLRVFYALPAISNNLNQSNIKSSGRRRFSRRGEGAGATGTVHLYRLNLPASFNINHPIMFRNIIINNQRPLSLINIRKHNALFSGRNHCNYSTTSGVSSPERQCYLEPLKSTDLTGNHSAMLFTSLTVTISRYNCSEFKSACQQECARKTNAWRAGRMRKSFAIRQ